MQIFNQSEGSNMAMCGDEDVARSGGERGLRSGGNLEQTAQRGVVEFTERQALCRGLALRL